MDIKALVPIVVQTSLFLLVFALGMRSNWHDLTYVVRKPADYGRALIAVNLVVPAAALILGSLLPIDWPTKVGLLMMAVSPLSPFVTPKMMNSGDSAYGAGIYIALILAAVIIVPLTLELLNPFYVRHATISVAVIARLVIESVLIPLLAGITIAAFLPKLARRAARLAIIFAYAALVPIIVLLLIQSGGQIIGLIGDGALVAIIGTVLAGLAAGHWLGGPDSVHRAALAPAAATRHPGIAALIVRGSFEEQEQPEVMVAIFLFLLVGMILTTLYLSWNKRRVAQSAQLAPQ